jgi:DNA-directed RNA polymerase subunit E'/Rpb7
MEPIAKSSKSKYRQKEFKGVYSPCQITKSIVLPMTAIGKNLQSTLENTISRIVGGKCIVEGYVKPGTIKVITFSSGIVKGENILFDVVFNCEVCYPVSGMNLNCVAKNITKAGITAESSDENPSPFILFIARDHYYASELFNSIQENDKFIARVIAQRFELNDKYISIIAELVPFPKDVKKELKPRLNLDD